MRWAQLNLDFITEMVQAMYKYEADQVNNPDTLTDAEMHDFYCSYCGM